MRKLKLKAATAPGASSAAATIEPLTYTFEEARALIGVGRDTMSRLLSSERIFSRKEGRRRIIPRWAVDEYIRPPHLRATA